MGDAWDIDPNELAEKKDHSQIRDAPPGVTGQDGSLLQHTVGVELSLRQLLPDHPMKHLWKTFYHMRTYNHTSTTSQTNESLHQSSAMPLMGTWSPDHDSGGIPYTGQKNNT